VIVDHADLVLDIPPAPHVEPVTQPPGCEPRRRSRPGTPPLEHRSVGDRH
jgi:alpha,alpha-trehalose phosphorylase